MTYIARIAFFSIAPMACMAAANVAPIMGAIINLALAIVMMFAGHWLLEHTDSPALAERIRRTRDKFLDYYRENPPRRFSYYVLYPFILPYWLINKRARRELALYKNLGLAAMVVLLAEKLVEFFRVWQPEIGLDEFVPVTLTTLIFEVIIILFLVMPIVTSLVELHLGGQRKQFKTLAIVGTVSFGIGVIMTFAQPGISREVVTRIRARAAAVPQKAARVHRQAEAAVRERVTGKTIGRDGKVPGDVTAAARRALRGLYRDDEASAFRVWVSPGDAPHVIVLYVPTSDDVFHAWDKTGAAITGMSELPERVREALE